MENNQTEKLNDLLEAFSGEMAKHIEVDRLESRKLPLHHLKISAPNGHANGAIVELDGKRMHGVARVELDISGGKRITPIIHTVGTAIDVEFEGEVDVPSISARARLVHKGTLDSILETIEWLENYLLGSSDAVEAKNDDLDPVVGAFDKIREEVANLDFLQSS